MKILFVVLFACFSIAGVSQVKKVSVQASGLTCSMCSNAISKSLQSLDFVEKVTSDIKNSSFEITFKSNVPVEFDRIRSKVEAAGFFVSKFVATINFNGESIRNDAHIYTGGKTYHFLDVKSQSLTGDQQVTFLDKGFVSSKTYRKNQALTSMACYKSGIAESCCSKTGLVKGTRIFHVTI